MWKPRFSLCIFADSLSPSQPRPAVRNRVQTNETHPLDQKSLRDLPHTESNLDKYLQREQAWERTSLGLPTSRKSGKKLVGEWDKHWTMVTSWK